MTTRSRVVFTDSLLIVLSMLSLPATAAPPRLAEEVVVEWLDILEEDGVPGAIIHVSTPYWEGTWTRGTADLSTGRAIKAGDYFRIASISKTFTAVVVLQLVEEGLLSLDDTLNKFKGGFGVPRADRITVRQLLNHTSGLGDWQESTVFQVSSCSRILVPLGLDRTSYPLDSAILSPAVHGYWTPSEFSDWCPSWSGYTGLSDGIDYNPSREFGCGAMISTAADLAV